MQILLTNDDGIYAPGLAAMGRALRRLGDVSVVAPATEQSGVGHAITFLTPLTAKEIFDGDRSRGWAVDGSPADAVKLGIAEFCPRRPDLVVSGINSGLNAGINVLYSGTVAAAIEGAFFGITSVAVSLEWDEHADYDRAAEIAQKLHETQSFLEIATERKAQLEKQVANARLLLKQHGLAIESLPRDQVPTAGGIVTAVADDSIEVTLGGDDGVQMGHFLEVYRDDEYLGRVQVISVKPDRSVGRVIREFKRGDIQPGDRVATRLKA